MKSLKSCLKGVAIITVAFGLMNCAANNRAVPEAQKSVAPAPTSAELTKGWSIHFCTGETIDDNVSVEIGRSGDESSHRVWRAINPRVDPKSLLPEDVRFVDKLWIKLTSENNREVEACLKYDGNTCKNIQFNDSREESVDRTNSEDCGC
ncbi:MAG: hypothetical protein WBP29_08740 [Candidatus Zixiibacteriota bacterium]